MLKLAKAYGLRFLVPPNDEGVGKCLLEEGEFARVELSLILAACDGDLLDIGANIGAICLPFASRRPDARVVAIESHPEIFQTLVKNVEANQLRNVDVVHAAAGEYRAHIEVPVPSIARHANVGAGSIYDTGFATTRVPMLPIDDLAPPKTRLVKIDVEGFEPRVLEGAQKLLTEIRPCWLVEISRHRPEASAQVRNKLAAAGYNLYWFFSPFIAPKPGKSGDFRGDFAVFACDGTPPWPMSPMGDKWASGESDLPYFANRSLFS